MAHTWKYNKEKHSVDEHFEPKSTGADIETYSALLRSIPVSGTVDWKDGEELEQGKDFQLHWKALGDMTVARPIKQEQPHRDGFIHEEGVTKTPYPIYPHEIRDEPESLGRFGNKKIKSMAQDKPILNEKFADNGEHSHWELINDDGKIVWSDDKDTVNPKCGICGGKQTLIRGRYPKTEARLTCPTCTQERIDQINEISSPHYGKAVKA